MLVVAPAAAAAAAGCGGAVVMVGIVCLVAVNWVAVRELELSYRNGYVYIYIHTCVYIYICTVNNRASPI